jgi:hypothetical protein
MPHRHGERPDGFAERIFGDLRRAAMAAELSSVDDSADHQRQADKDRLTRTAANIERRQAAVLRQPMDGGPHYPFAKSPPSYLQRTRRREGSYRGGAGRRCKGR